MKNNKDKDFAKSYQAVDQVSYQASDQVSFEKAILEFCKTERSLKEILDKTGYKGRVYFKKKFINPLLEKGLLKATKQTRPNSPTQKYYTVF